MNQQLIDKACRGIFPQGENKEICKPTECNLYPRAYKNCHIAEKTDNQLKYILSSKKDNIFLKACPGSGKTEVIGLKAAYEFQLWKHKNNGIAILTFTNNAADTIWERVQQFAGIGKTTYPHFIGTIDRWLYGYLAQPFGCLITGYEGEERDKSMKIVEDSISDGWINNYTCKTPYYYQDKKGKLRFKPLYANNIRFDFENMRWEIKRLRGGEYIKDEDYFNSETFQKSISENSCSTLKIMRKKFFQAKQNFSKDGFVTHYDIECICYRLLKKYANIAQRLSQRFPFIIIDECQDLSWIQMEIFKFLKQYGTSIHFVGDLNQAIYEFKKVDPKNVESFITDNKFKSLYLTDNFRSCQSIVDICQKIVNGDRVIGKEESSLCYQPCICIQYKKDEIVTLPARFEKHLKKVGINTDKSAILARGWSTVYKLNALNNGQVDKPQFQLAMAIHLYGIYKKVKDELLKETLKYLGKFLAKIYFKDKHCNSHQYYCPKIVDSPMRWRIFLSNILGELLEKNCDISDLNKTWKDWVGCVRKQISITANNYLSILQIDNYRFEQIEGKFLKAPANKGGEKVIDSLCSGKKIYTKIQITTIHKAKGKTFDAVLLVSTSQKGNQGGHWEEWLKDVNAESARFSYVASSRPKKLLVWAISETKDLSEIEKLGFHAEKW